MYNKSIVNHIISKVETSIDFKLGVKERDIMDPVLFLFLMMDFSETLEDEWTDLDTLDTLLDLDIKTALSR